MTPKGYTTKAAIENYLLQNIATTFDSQLNDWICGVEKIIDQLTGRNFKADSAASVRVFDGDGSEDLLIDDCIAVTKVEVGNDEYGGSFTEIAASGTSDMYFTYPANAASKGLPIHKIKLNARTFPEGRQNNRITAKWGFSAAVPEDIQFVATVFVAGILNQQIPGGDQIKSESIGNYSVSYNTDNGMNSWADFERAKEILNSYRDLNI